MKGSPPLSPRRGDERTSGLELQLADPALYGLLKQFVKENRNHETTAEMVLWKFIRGDQLGVHFRRQHIIEMFIADFVCLSKRLVIELDGGYHQLPELQISDEERSKWLEDKGFKVIRFSNEEVLGNIEGTITSIKAFIYGTK